MAREIALLASGTGVLQADGTTNYTSADSGETNSEIILLTKRYMPLGAAGDCVFRRLYLSFTQSTGAYFRVTPIVDGRVITDAERVVVRPAMGDTERYTAVIPLGEVLAGRTASAGVRGSSLQLYIKTTAPGQIFHLEGVEIIFQSALRAKRPA